MNIFVLDEDPFRAAVAHCDVHVVKMILETTQMLCTVRHQAGSPLPNGYKPTHENHPCTKWAGRSRENWWWTVHLLRHLHGRYEYRYEKTHQSKRLLPSFLEFPAPVGGLATPFVFVGPDECVGATAVERYRALYRLKQTTMKRPMRWTKDPRPEWVDP